MFDRHLIPLVRRPLAALAAPLARRHLSPNQLTLAGFAIGLLVVPLLAFGCYGAALLLIALNRLCDGLDGALARLSGGSDSGGFLDIVCDFIFYAAVVLGFALADPANNALPAAFLLFCFMGTGASFLAFAVMAARYGLQSPVYRNKSLYYLGGLTEGSETMALFAAMCLWPAGFAPLAWGFGALCLLTTAGRVYYGFHTIHRAEETR